MMVLFPTRLSYDPVAHGDKLGTVTPIYFVMFGDQLPEGLHLG